MTKSRDIGAQRQFYAAIRERLVTGNEEMKMYVIDAWMRSMSDPVRESMCSLLRACSVRFKLFSLDESTPKPVFVIDYGQQPALIALEDHDEVLQYLCDNMQEITGINTVMVIGSGSAFRLILEWDAQFDLWSREALIS